MLLQIDLVLALMRLFTISTTSLHHGEACGDIKDRDGGEKHLLIQY